MHQRIQCQPSLATRRIVAKRISDESVGELMHRKGDDQHNDSCNEFSGCDIKTKHEGGCHAATRRLAIKL